jgi:hypothetical protein
LDSGVAEASVVVDAEGRFELALRDGLPQSADLVELFGGRSRHNP